MSWFEVTSYLYTIKPSSKCFLISCDLLRRSGRITKLGGMTCMMIIGELISDFLIDDDILNSDRFPDLYPDEMKEVMRAVDGILETEYGMDKTLEKVFYDRNFRDEVYELACAMTILKIGGSDLVRSIACCFLMENARNIHPVPRFGFQIQDCIPVISQLKSKISLLKDGFTLAKHCVNMWILQTNDSLILYHEPIHERIYKEFELPKNKHLNEGQFGKIYRVSPNLVVKSQDIYDFGMLPRNTAWNELNALRQLKHENIIELRNFFIEDDEGDLKLQLVMDYAEGTLLNAKPNKRYYNELMTGLAHIHHRGFLHMDIKPGNILLVNDKVKIADMGTAARNSHELQLYVNVGTMNYRAPELLRYGKNWGTQAKIDYNADIWSAAVTILQVELGKIIFGEDDEYGVLKEIFDMIGTSDEDFWPITVQGMGVDYPIKGTGIPVSDRKLRLTLQRMLTYDTRIKASEFEL